MMAQTKLKRRGIGLEFGHTYVYELVEAKQVEKKEQTGYFLWFCIKNAKSRVVGPFFAFRGCI